MYLSDDKNKYYYLIAVDYQQNNAEIIEDNSNETVK